jgi:hypothetical protein
MNSAPLLWGILFSLIDLAFFMYGKKQTRAVPLVCGMMLMIYPYFVPSTIWLVVIGCVLCVVPFFVRV